MSCSFFRGDAIIDLSNITKELVMNTLDFDYLFWVVKPLICQLQVRCDEERREDILRESKLLFYRLVEQYPKLLEDKERFYRYYIWAMKRELMIGK